ncbi:MAG TPA: D-glycero-beta-D-manno-heptose 1,7-bisphosphate 7-phosphatase [Chloroflexi bacterium]|nr:D-glycero-beta-D-manno-heptose 1,7-bisphosphate 7-phosphatase [Chloroflexota bacterium]
MNCGVISSIMESMDTALFLDRDGVIIENRANYVRSCDDVTFLPAALAALRQAAASPYRIIVVTNQSAIDRGIITMAQADTINHHIVGEIENAGGRVDAVFMCPHTPLDQCDCRKPRPGMLLQAAEQFHIDLRRSFMIGDSLADLLAGRAAGVRESIIVRTGRGAVQAALPEAHLLQPFPLFDSLYEALDSILQQTNHPLS